MADLQGVAAVLGNIEERSDLGTSPDAVWRFWNSQLSLAEREDEDFIKRGRRTVDRFGGETEIATRGRHDPCVGIRAVPIGEAMVACVIADHYLRQRGQVGEPPPWPFTPPGGR